MQPSLQPQRTQQEEQQRDRPFEHLAAPALSTALDAVAFGPGPAAVKALFKMDPLIFRGMNIADGTNLPSLKNVLVATLLGEQEARVKAA